jgi:S-adenosylmethionine decarboxylase
MCGLELVVEAHGCDFRALACLPKLKELFTHLIGSMDLHPVGEATWHQFPGTGGVTGLHLLSESHLACHTFPEYGSLCLNIFCCRPRPACDVKAILEQEFGATAVHVRALERPYAQEGQPQ